MEKGSYPPARVGPKPGSHNHAYAGLGSWLGHGDARSLETITPAEALEQIGMPLYLVRYGAELSLETPSGGTPRPDGETDYPIVGYVPAILPDHLGDRGFCRDHGIRFPYLTGAMANGIGSVEIVEAMGRAGMLGFFGAAGLPLRTIEDAVLRLQSSLGGLPHGVNLIHTPQEPHWEESLVDLLIARQVRLVEASAYLNLTLPVVKYRVHGIHEDNHGRIVIPNKIIAKVSRVEVASKFMAPPPQKFLGQLVEAGEITEAQAALASRIPMAQDFTAEADSGGHTDNRPAITLLPTMLALRDRLHSEFDYPMPIRIGLAGGISTPASAAAAFAMGASFVLTGSVNQSCVEAGTSEMVRDMLARAQQADIAMAPAADMFEMGVNVQVLKRGTMFAMRAAKLYDLYRNQESLDTLSSKDRGMLEKNIFRMSIEDVWQRTRAYFQERDPRQVGRAERDSRHKMALVFRWYLGKSSNWANTGDASRKVDYQVWCGPAMGAFNEWVRGSFLEMPERRDVVAVAFNILYGAAMLARLHALRIQGFRLEPMRMGPRKVTELKEYFI